MVINIEKTKSMKIGRTQENLDIHIGNNIVEQVEAFKYLGIKFVQHGGTEAAFRDRLSLGQRSFGRLIKIWKDRNISTKLKVRVLRAIVIPTALYGAECWIMRKYEEKRLLAFEMRCLRRIYGVRWEDRITNERVRQMASVTDNVLDRVRDMQRRWFGHTERMHADRWPRVAMHGRVHGDRPRGRPRDTWIKRFMMQNEGRTTQELANMAADRERWTDWRHHMWDPTRRDPDGT